MRKSMKWLGIMILCIVNIVSLEASLNRKCNGKVIELMQKFYVQQDQIHFNNNKIYINIEDFTYATPALLSDENGYYIDQVVGSGSCAWYEWQCTRCLTCNLRGLNLACKSCNKSMSGDFQ